MRNWESLAHRRWARGITHFLGICMILYLEDVYLFMTLVVLTLSMKSDLIQINIEKSFFPAYVKARGNLTDDFRNCTSVNAFKTMVTSLIRPPTKSTFGIYVPEGIKIYFN